MVDQVRVTQADLQKLDAQDKWFEVVSPGQSNPLMLSKIARYLRGGCQEAWLIYPAHKTIVQYRRENDIPAIYEIGDAMDMSGLFPGLTLKVDDLFVTP